MKKIFSMEDVLDELIESSGVLQDFSPKDQGVFSPYSIDVFIEWNNCLATMLYPSQEPKWVKRSSGSRRLFSRPLAASAQPRTPQIDDLKLDKFAALGYGVDINR